MNKRDLVFNVLDKATTQTYIPAAFFIHFDESCHRGPAAVEKHLEFFRYTGMDFVKIQYENNFPNRPEIKGAEDWAKMPLYKKEFYEDPLKTVEDLVKAAKKEAPVIMTLYSPFMCAGHSCGRQFAEHIKENPEKAKKGIEIITESLMIFVKECIELGIDGFYHSTQGGESFRFEDNSLFEECVKPYDLMLMEEINRTSDFNILHICDYVGGYTDLTPFKGYPGDVVNCNLELEAGKLTGKEVSDMFDMPFMGGLDRLGTIATGTKEEVRKTVEGVLKDAPERFILGADCTIPSDVDWDNIKTAISTAHGYKR